MKRLVLFMFCWSSSSVDFVLLWWYQTTISFTSNRKKTRFFVSLSPEGTRCVSGFLLKQQMFVFSFESLREQRKDDVGLMFSLIFLSHFCWSRHNPAVVRSDAWSIRLHQAAWPIRINNTGDHWRKLKVAFWITKRRNKVKVKTCASLQHLHRLLAAKLTNN